jgi:hypothetical protein
MSHLILVKLRGLVSLFTVIFFKLHYPHSFEKIQTDPNLGSRVFLPIKNKQKIK